MLSKLQANVFAFDYRGYGFSQGTPSEPGLIEDSEAALNYLAELGSQKVIDPNKVFLFGRSLGGAVVVQLASRGIKLPLQPAGIIIENSFTSIADMLDSLFPFLAFSILKKNFLRLKWETEKTISQIKVPILFLSGEKDELVPAGHMTRLKNASKTNVCEFHTFPEGTHNDTWLVSGDRYWDVQKSFINDNVATNKK